MRSSSLVQLTLEQYEFELPQVTSAWIHLCMDFFFQINTYYSTTCSFPSSSVVKNLPANVGDMGLIPGLEDPLE